MKNIFVISALIVGLCANFASAQTAATVVVSGAVEHMEAMENEATIKVVGLQKLLFIKNLTSFSDAKLQVIMDSQDTKKLLKFKVNESNQVLDVAP